MIKKILLSSVLCGALFTSANAYEVEIGAFAGLGHGVIKSSYKYSVDSKYEYSSSSTSNDVGLSAGGDYTVIFDNNVMTTASGELSYFGGNKLIAAEGKVGYRFPINVDAYGILGVGYLLPDSSYHDNAASFGFGIGGEYKLPVNLPLSVGAELKAYSFDVGHGNDLDFTRLLVKVKYRF